MVKRDIVKQGPEIEGTIGFFTVNFTLPPGDRLAFWGTLTRAYPGTDFGHTAKDVVLKIGGMRVRGVLFPFDPMDHKDENIVPSPDYFYPAPQEDRTPGWLYSPFHQITAPAGSLTFYGTFACVRSERVGSWKGDMANADAFEAWANNFADHYRLQRPRPHEFTRQLVHAPYMR